VQNFLQLFQGADSEHFSLGSQQSWTFLVMFLITLLYGITLSLLYNVYFKKGEARDLGLARSFIFLTPTLMTIFWVVQFSLPLSVGLVGTLSFVRFRSPVKRAEDVAFIVIVLACSISCAVNRPLMGGILILVFLAYAFFRNVFGLNSKESTTAVFTYSTKKVVGITDIEELMRKLSATQYELVSINVKEGHSSVVLKIPYRHQSEIGKLTTDLESADNGCGINVLFPQSQTSGS